MFSPSVADRAHGYVGADLESVCSEGTYVNLHVDVGLLLWDIHFFVKCINRL